VNVTYVKLLSTHAVSLGDLMLMHAVAMLTSRPAKLPPVSRSLAQNKTSYSLLAKLPPSTPTPKPFTALLNPAGVPPKNASRRYKVRRCT
jgi:hypothetical protein